MSFCEKHFTRHDACSDCVVEKLAVVEAERDLYKSIADEHIDAITNMLKANKALAKVQAENDKLRGMIAYSDMNCVYCGLPKADMNKCQHGFPGCGRADDMMNYPEGEME